MFLSSYQGSITRLAGITRSHALSVSSHVLWHKYTEGKRKIGRKREIEEGVTNELAVFVFPTCQTAESSSLKLFANRIWYEKNPHIVIISNNSLWRCLTSFDSSNSLQGSRARSHASSVRLQTQLNNQGFNCCIIPQSINRGFLGYLDEIKQIPQETNTENLSVKQMRRSQIS